MWNSSKKTNGKLVKKMETSIKTSKHGGWKQQRIQDEDDEDKIA